MRTALAFTDRFCFPRRVRCCQRRGLRWGTFPPCPGTASPEGPRVPKGRGWLWALQPLLNYISLRGVLQLEGLVRGRLPWSWSLSLSGYQLPNGSAAESCASPADCAGNQVFSFFNLPLNDVVTSVGGGIRH